MIDKLLVLGASGDLAGRYLLPALAHLQEAGRLPQLLTIVGVTRDDWDTATFHRHLAAQLERHTATVDPGPREALAAMSSYQRADAGDAAALAGALDQAKGPVVAYLALPPAAFAPAIQALAEVGLPDRSRVVVEKPFGRNLAEARALNQLLGRCFGEAATFRADHFLGLQTVQDVLGLRFANRVFEPIWHAEHIQRVEIVWDEMVALESAGYYDHVGALRDVVQNHLLQLACLVAMEPPARLDPDRLHDRKVELLRAVQPPPPGQMAARTVRGRYTAGRVDGIDVPAYADEPGVDPARGTETFAEVTLEIDNPRWRGVPFRLRTGKALVRRRAEILIHFRPACQPTFAEAAGAPANLLRFGLDPDRLTLPVNLNGSGDPFRLEQATLE
ncbi:MAG TPA: glucose-6-phosphate dehydrogenase, partial [Actinomycetes bacterium]|nr:glucose-6-phosphate dehydrogenase [Actinomycetes bacterium]